MLHPYLPYLNSLNILLASVSPHRRDLLELLGVQFTVGGSGYSEDQDWRAFPSPVAYVQSNALLKLNSAQTKYPEADLIIVADTIVEAGGEVLEKPDNEEDAKRMMRLLSNTKHQVHTALFVQLRRNENAIISSCVETTAVYFEELDESMIQAYVATGEWQGEAGGYKVRTGAGASLISRIEGCYYNAIGLPLSKLTQLLINIVPKATT